MTQEVKEYISTEFGTVRTITESDKTWFCATDVTRILGYTNGRDAVARHCRKDGVAKHDGVSATTNQYGVTSQQDVQLTFIDEGNLYRLIAHSKLPAAQRFESWVFDEVLPDIRKHGMYATATAVESFLQNPDNLIQILTAYKEEKDAREQLETECEELRCENDLLSTQIDNAQPLVNFAASVASSDSLITISDLAKIIAQNGHNIGGKRLFEWMRSNGYLCTTKGFTNSPTQRSMNLGLFRVCEYTVSTAQGTRISYTPKVTAKGQIYFINKFVKE